jgi:hypothetical protein
LKKRPVCNGRSKKDLPSQQVFLKPCYSSNTIIRQFIVFPEDLSDCFAVIKKMIPPCEMIPKMLKTSEDDEKTSLWHELMEY